MYSYESVLLFDPNLEDEKVDELLEKFSGFISKNEGEVVELERWGKRALAYEINDVNRANYILVHFNSPPQAIKALERQYQLSEPVLRSLTIKKLSPYSPNIAAPEAAPKEEE